MNLKEAFRYQNFLDKMMGLAGESIATQSHNLIVTKKHLRSKANPDAQDTEEVVDYGEFFASDDVLTLMLRLVDEKERLSAAISKAKAGAGIDLDAAIAANKFRQILRRKVDYMLCSKASQRTERGTDYRFNVEGNQTAYSYDVEVTATENFDRNRAKQVVRDIISEADDVSAKIDAAMINIVVDYTPPFNVNDSFEDVMQSITE